VSTTLELVQKAKEEIEKLCKRLGVPLDIVYRVYCMNEPIPEKIEDKLLQLENELADRFDVDVDELFSSLCPVLKAELGIQEEKAEAKPRLEVARPEYRIEKVFEFNVYSGGSAWPMRIIVDKSRIVVETKLENVCKEPDDVVVGETTIYLKCGGQWICLVHDMTSEKVRMLRRAVRRET